MKNPMTGKNHKLRSIVLRVLVSKESMKRKPLTHKSVTSKGANATKKAATITSFFYERKYFITVQYY